MVMSTQGYAPAGIAAFMEKLQAFRDSLSAEERDWLDMIVRRSAAGGDDAHGFALIAHRA